MRTVRKSKRPDNSVILEPEAFRQLMAIAAESHRSPDELCSIAIRVFATATRHLVIMHQPKESDKPLKKAERNQAIIAVSTPLIANQSKPKGKPSPIVSIGVILRNNVKTIKDNLRCQNQRKSQPLNRRN